MQKTFSFFDSCGNTSSDIISAHLVMCLSDTTVTKSFFLALWIHTLEEVPKRDKVSESTFL